MMPRLFDERVRLFHDQHLWITAATSNEPPQRPSSRGGGLEKKDPNAELSEPVKPIVYYLDSATPGKMAALYDPRH
jgi:hypothetical protein